jgi:hypothetical protein
VREFPCANRLIGGCDFANEGQHFVADRCQRTSNRSFRLIASIRPLAMIRRV